jgi:hypothetical protein
MGSGASKEVGHLVCPESYQEDKFNKILKLFDRLDEDGDQIVENDELKCIAQLHIKNKINLLNLDLQKNKITYKSKNELYLEKKKLEIKKLENEWDIRINNYKTTYETEVESIDQKLNNYRDMKDEEKQKKFMNVITDDNNNIDFWKFFEYIKDKTDDIDNIKFS